ncbi:acetylhydrolase [Teratosphaeria destructans]|uniref:Putative phospholipase n=1 Tax=Teratosphaeria destructans TaxID=418781 RepID=A0A9W7SJZ5_9PEZI|nr:acetylhydrolase [Teratosphaeria destructans]
MASLLSGWNPIKFFPAYHGPYDVGTVDVEIPVADLPLPSNAPEDAQPTIAFRIFYPCQKPQKDEVDRPVRWIPQPQRATIASFAKFLGLPQKIAGAFSYIPQQLYWIKLPAHRNARLLDPPTNNGRWPVTFFSHGLAGSRNAYSQICGDLAANGMIVIALDHRDGSSPIQYVRATATTEAHIVYPTKIPHHPVTDAVYEGRDKQIRIRLWEISMAYEALVKIDKGHNIENLDSNTSKLRKERMEVLWQFNDMMDIHTPGKVTWAGHSFGAATTVQLLKSIFYYRERSEEDCKTLIRPNADAAIIQQIVPESPTLLLDMWGLPLQSPSQKFLWDRPLPSYGLGGPNGANVLSVLSEAFQNWEDNLNINKAIAAKPSMSRRPSVTPIMSREKGHLLPAFARLRARSPASDSGYASSASRSLTRQASRASMTTTPSKSSSAKTSPERSSDRTAGPHMFYVGMTQHFNQSDFGIVFPYIALRVTKAQEPVRCLELNTRAMVQVIREAGIEVAGEDDKEILDKESGIRKWVPIPIDEEEERQTSRPGALQAIDRKLSVTSTKSMSSPRLQSRDGMTMGQKMQAQLEFTI